MERAHYLSHFDDPYFNSGKKEALMADAKSNGCVAPFSDKELEKIRQFCDDGLCPQCENDHRFLATIAARDKRIEILENREKLIIKKGREFEATTIKQAATIERLRGTLENITKWGNQMANVRRYARQALTHKE